MNMQNQPKSDLTWDDIPDNNPISETEIKERLIKTAAAESEKAKINDRLLAEARKALETGW